MNGKGKVSRRGFVKGALAAGAAVGTFHVLRASGATTSRAVKVGLVGCGGRGNGALSSNVEAGKLLGVGVKVVAAADFFKEKAEKTGQRFGVPAERCFDGIDSYKKLLETDVELVLDVTAPLFRPLHLEAYIQAGKHAFVEKPVAVDPPGCRRVIAAGELARQKGLVIVSGTEMRHQRRFVDTRQALATEGALGRLIAGRIAFCARHFFRREPIQPKSAADLIGSWQNWLTLSGDHLVEQHVHNIDIANWFAGRPPVSAAGFGGRARRPAGDMYDFFSVDYDYGDGVHVHSMCRQVNDCWNWVGHDLAYERGHTNGSDGPEPKQSPWPADLPQVDNGHLQEQINTLYYVLKGKPLDQAKDVAESTAAAVLGRISAYTGRLVTWQEMMVDPKANPDVYGLTLRPTAEDFQTGNIAIPEEGKVAVPGSSVGTGR